MAHNNVFFKSVDIYRGDYRCMLFSRDYEFNPGSHYHDFYEVQFYLQDTGSIIINDKEYELRLGSIVLLNMFEPHAIKLNPGLKYYERFCISISPSFLLAACTEDTKPVSIFDPDSKNYPIFSPGDSHFFEYLDLLLRYETLEAGPGQDIFERAIVYEILAQLYRDLFDETNTKVTDTESIKVISTLLRYISEHLKDELSLDSLAAEFGYSKYHLCRLFKKCTGTTINHYVNEKRIELAKQNLLTNMMLIDISHESGYNNYSYFYKSFSKAVGIGPQEYRARELKKKES